MQGRQDPTFKVKYLRICFCLLSSSFIYFCKYKIAGGISPKLSGGNSRKEKERLVGLNELTHHILCESLAKLSRFLFVIVKVTFVHTKL